MSISPSVNPEPLFSVDSFSQKTSSSAKVCNIKVVNSNKVILTLENSSSSKKTIEVVPKVFGIQQGQDISSISQEKMKDYLKNLRWHVVGKDGEYSVEALPRLMGGGNDNSTSKSKTKKSNKSESSENKLTREDQELLTTHLKFTPDRQKDIDWQRIALRGACSLEDVELQLKVLSILLVKLKILPDLVDVAGYHTIFDFRSPLNEPALQLFLDAGIQYKNLPLHTIQLCNYLPLFKKCIDAGANLYQRCSLYNFTSAFFQKADNITSCDGPFLHEVILDKKTEFFDYVNASRTDININSVDSLGRTVLISQSTFSEHIADHMDWILSKNPDMNIMDQFGRTALFYLLMSVSAVDFETNLTKFLDVGLNLNAPLKNATTQFCQCLKLLTEFDQKRKDLDVWNPEVIQKIMIMLRRGADPTQLPLSVYIQLPMSLQAAFESHLSSAHLELSDSADTSSGGSPKRLSESPKKGFISSNALDMLSTGNPALKQTIESALKKAYLSFLFSASNRDEAGRASLMNCLMSALPALIGQPNPSMFEGILTFALMTWKNTELAKIQQNTLMAQQNEALQKNLAEANAITAQAKRYMENAQHAADMAEMDQIAAAGAASSAHRAALTANTFRH